MRICPMAPSFLFSSSELSSVIAWLLLSPLVGFSEDFPSSPFFRALFFFAFLADFSASFIVFSEIFLTRMRASEQQFMASTESSRAHSSSSGRRICFTHFFWAINKVKSRVSKFSFLIRSLFEEDKNCKGEKNKSSETLYQVNEKGCMSLLSGFHNMFGCVE